MIRFIFLSIFSYTVGSIPSGYLVGKLHGINVFKVGSKSASSTNVARVLGWRWAILSAVLDFSKGVLFAYLAKSFLASEWQIILVAILPMIGQVLPVFLKFRGGKGASTFYGSVCGLIGIKYFVFFFPVFLALLLITKKTSLANIIFSWILIFLVFIFSVVIVPPVFPISYLAFTVIGASFLLFALRENIQRLLQGKEPDTPFKW